MDQQYSHCQGSNLSVIKPYSMLMFDPVQTVICTLAVYRLVHVKQAVLFSAVLFSPLPTYLLTFLVCLSVWEAAIHQFPGGNEKDRGSL